MERSCASKVARPPSTSAVLGASAKRLREATRVIGDAPFTYRCHTITSPSYGSYVSISRSMTARIAISSDASATTSSDS